jgi:hypothetical protein
MRIRRVSSVVLAVLTCTISSCFAAGADTQEPSNSKDTSTIAVAATEPVQLSASAQDILKLSRAKVGEDVIIAFVQGHSRHFDLTASEIVHLRENGVSDRVLAAMVNQQPPALAPQSPPQPAAPVTAASVSADAAGNTPAPAATVYVVPPSAPYSYAPYPYYYGYSYPAVSVGFAFGTGWGYGHYGGCYRGGYYYGGHSHGGHLTVVGGGGGGHHH